MHCISVTYRKAPVEVREKFAWSNKEIAQFQNEEKISSSENGVVIISTCNRSEIYFSSDIGMNTMLELLKEYKDVDDSLIDDYADLYLDEDAEKHLFEVTSGMDSMVLGEDEVQRQVKDAYQFAHELGKTGIEINMLFQGALKCSRKIKAGTDIKYLPVSIGTLTANYAAEFAGRLGRKANALIFGASGKIGKVVVKDMLDLGCFNIYCTKRTHHIELDEHDCSDITEIDYDERYGLMNDADIVISATKSPHCVITKDRVEANVDDHKERLMIDLAIPRDIEPEVAEVEGVTLYDVDFIKAISEENNKKKAELKKEMDHIVDEVYHEVKEDIGFSLLLAEKKKVLDADTELRKKIYKMRADHSLEDIRNAIEVSEFAARTSGARNTEEPGYFPFMVNLSGKRVLIVGAGKAAKYKVRSLVEAGADLTVIAPAFSPEIEQYSDRAVLLRKAYKTGEAAGFDVVVAATDNSDVNDKVIYEAQKAGALTCSAASPDDGDFIFPAVIRKKDYQIAVSTDGRDPYAAGQLRKKIEEGLTEELSGMVELNPARHRRVIRVGSRESLLAQAQTDMVIAELNNLGYECRKVLFRTTGDKMLDRPLRDFGGKAVFVTEIEDALLNDEIDIAVHSAKDMPGELADGLTIAACLPREDVHDVLITRKGMPREDIRVLGTSSLRRQVQVDRYLPDVTVKDLRGNVPTRIRKLKEGEYDAIILAAAGIRRLGIQADPDLEYEYIDIDDSLPAAGQGIIAIESKESGEVFDIVKKLDRKNDRMRLMCERAFMRAIGADCHDAVAAYSKLRRENIYLSVMKYLKDGCVFFSGEAPSDEGEKLAAELGGKVLKAEAGSKQER